MSCLLLGTVIAGACGTPSASPGGQVAEPALRESLLLSAAPGPTDRSCNIPRSDLLPADELVDSAAVMTALRDIESSTVLLSIGFDGFGAPEFVRVLEAEGEQAEQLAEIARRESRQQPDEPRERTWRLKLESGPDARIRAGYTEVCSPVLLNPDAISRALSASRVRGTGQVVAQYQVGPDGRVLASRVARTSGDRTMDRVALEVGEELRFMPGLLDGIPSILWVQIPINFGRSR
ncbi:MAG: energy transducer TonB [Longimicrobiales bacterium]|nr:energy transducer TonB [Longimicrobiales bacterium]